MIARSEFARYQQFENFGIERRGLFDRDGNSVLITPTSAQIAGFPEDPRVEYFSTLGENPLMIDHVYKPVSPVEISPYFIQYTLDPLSERLRSDFPRRKKLGIRGTAVSLDGDLPYKDRLSTSGLDNVTIIRGMESILKVGSDSGKEKPGYAVFDLKREENLQSYMFPSNYLRFYSRGFSYSLKKYGYNLNSIFPILLVYDLSFATKGVTINLEAARKQGKQALLKAYVLDYSAYKE